MDQELLDKVKAAKKGLSYVITTMNQNNPAEWAAFDTILGIAPVIIKVNKIRDYVANGK